jgi:hypothetical protein
MAGATFEKGIVTGRSEGPLPYCQAASGYSAMPSESRNTPEQEHSIKSRAHEVFAKQNQETGNRPTKPFPVYLRETPAFPMSPTVKAMLWFAGIIVGILFLAAVLKLSLRYGPKRRGSAPPPAAKTEGVSLRPQFGRDALRTPENRRRTDRHES